MNIAQTISEIKSLRWILIIVLLFFGLQVTIESVNNRFWLNDFKVYYDAGNAYLNGNSPYGEAFGLSSGFFKYSPLSLLTALFYQSVNFETAKYIHFVLMFLAFSGSLIQLSLLTQKEELKQVRLALFLTFAVAVIHLTRELHLGNVNLFLIFGVLYSVRCLKDEKPLPAAIVMALVLFFKPYFLFLSLPFLVFKQWKVILYVIGFAALFTLIQVLIFGATDFYDLHQQWFSAMMDHSEGMPADHSIPAIIENYTGTSIGSKVGFGIIAAIACAYLAIRLFVVRLERFSDFTFDIFLLLALIPNLVTTDVQHFLYSLPLIFYCLLQLSKNGKLWQMIVFGVLCLVYASNSTDILGKELILTMNSYSAIGLANLSIVLFSMVLKKGNA